MRTFSLTITLLLFGYAGLPTAFAQSKQSQGGGAVFGGGGLNEGINQAQQIQGISQQDLPTTITNVLTAAINVLGLLAVVSIIISGIMFILSLGNEETAGKAKKGIIYSVVGLIIILFTKAIVTFITNLG